jgi:SOS-response transcriptional repressor LexA
MLVRAVRKSEKQLGITRRQRQTLEIIRTYSLEHGEPPTFRQIAAALGTTSSGSVHRLVTCLVERGHLTGAGGHHRALKPTELSRKITVELPTEVDTFVRALASSNKTSPAAIIIESLRDSAAAFARRTQKVSRETEAVPPR